MNKKINNMASCSLCENLQLSENYPSIVTKYVPYKFLLRISRVMRKSVLGGFSYAQQKLSYTAIEDG